MVYFVSREAVPQEADSRHEENQNQMPPDYANNMLKWQTSQASGELYVFWIHN